MTGGRKSGRQKIAAKIKGNTQDPQGSCGLWLIKGPHALNTRTNCKYGAPISNGDLLRLVPRSFSLPLSPSLSFSSLLIDFDILYLIL